MNGRIQHGYCIWFAGPSQCGKTSTLCKLLVSKEYFYPRPPKQVMWVSGSGAPNGSIESKIKTIYPESQFFHQVLKIFLRWCKNVTFWVFDDMASELKNNTCFTNFFTKTAHHKNCLMAYLTQNARSGWSDKIM